MMNTRRWGRWALAGAVGWMIAGGSWTAEAKGRLSRARSEVRGSSSSGSSSSSSSSSNSSRRSSSSSSSSSDSTWWPSSHPHHHHHYYASPSASPSSSSSTATSGESDVELGIAGFEAFPYASGSPGHMTRDDGSRLFSGRLALGGAYMPERWGQVEGAIGRADVSLDLHFWRLGMHHDIGFYLERPLHDAIYLGSSTATLAFIFRPKIVWRVGGGVQYMIDGRTPGQGPREYALGGVATTRLDIFPVRPLVLTGRLDAGRLHAATTITAAATVGIVLNRFEVYGGWEHRQIGDVPLGGPTFGLRMWF